MAGVAAPLGINNDDFYLVKTDLLGNVEWNRTYGVESANEIAWSVKQTSDNGFILAGDTFPFASSSTDAWVVKTDQNGNMIWNKTYGRPEGGDWIYCVQLTSDGGYVMAGCLDRRPTLPTSGDFWLFKIDEKGDIQWSQQYGDSDPFNGRSEAAYSVQETSDRGFIAVGDIFPSSSESDILLVRTDFQGTMIWNKTLEGSGCAVIQTSDKGYAVVGSSRWVSVEIGCDFLFVKKMRANPPVADFTYYPAAPSAREEISFNASNSRDLDEDLIAYRWDFGDDNSTSTNIPTITHNCETPGVYNVTLTVIDSADLNSSRSEQVLARIYTNMSVFTSPESDYVGFRVNINGILVDMYGIGLKNESVVLYYNLHEIGTWVPIGSDSTDNLGNFYVMWAPQATGYFAIKAVYAGNETHVGSSATVALSILPYENQYVFSVESNSTISDLSFDPDSGRLSFSASGENGTVGRTRVTIAKSLIVDASKIKVRIDGLEYNYSLLELNDSWILVFSYNHSAHAVEVDMQAAIPEFLSPLVGLSLFALISALVVFGRVKKRSIGSSRRAPTHSYDTSIRLNSPMAKDMAKSAMNRPIADWVNVRI